MVRLDEARESARLIAACRARCPAGPASVAPLGPLRAGAHATAVVEAWRGPVLALGARGRARRARHA